MRDRKKEGKAENFENLLVLAYWYPTYIWIMMMLSPPFSSSSSDDDDELQSVPQKEMRNVPR